MLSLAQTFALIRRLKWKELTRSAHFDMQLIVKGAICFFVTLGAFLFFVLLWNFGEIMEEMDIALDRSVSSLINKYLYVYFVLEFVLRFFTQKTPHLAVEKYLIWPVKKSYLSLYALYQSLISIPTLFLVVFSWTCAYRYYWPEWGFLSALAWVVSVMSISLLLHALVFFFKAAHRDLTVFTLLVLVFFGALSAIDTYTSFRVLDYVEKIFSLLINGPILAVFFVSLCMGVWYILLKYFTTQLNNPAPTANSNMAFLDRNLGLGQRWGLEGYFAEIEWKLIIRHKRTRHFLFMSGLFLFYGLLYYGDAVEKDYPFMLIMVGLMLMTNFISQYAVNFFSWNSSFFEFYLTKPHGLRALLLGKLILLKYLTIVIFILSLPYLYFGWQILHVHMAMALYAMGIGIYFFSWQGISLPVRLDLNKRGSTQSGHGEGFGCMQVFVFVPLLILPLTIIYLFKYLDIPTVGFIVISLIGFFGLLLFTKAADFLNQKAQRKKYFMIDQFNKKT